MAFMLPVIKNDHPFLDPKSRRPSFALNAARKASYTYGENRHRLQVMSTPDGRQKSKSVSNDASLLTTRVQLASRYRSSSSNDQPSTSTATSHQGKVGQAKFIMDAPMDNTCSSSPSSSSSSSPSSSSSSANRISLSSSPCEKKAQQKSWSQCLTWIQSKRRISDTR